ncbi:ferritin-like domain-containing protein [Meiothermus sp. CFH 77666]|uniref:ferritin-like domain-containing protein n=1 Tax=Meiothermus sp. CFH 77666 TaxID=2817942 RepID=UPI001AA09C28|nr:ferritin-like domain-containing protein [Meiothermus sp. CFH 77666]MBO1435955.1 ferritin-like domain-containing protein [Meiothermus sp. CFH 77666]
METQPQNLARRQFVKVLTATGLSAAVAHSLVGRVLAQSQGVSDLDVLNLALTAEYLATDAYTRALTVSFPGEIRDYLAEALKHEEAHVKALTDTIRGPFAAMPVARPQFTYGDLQFNTANRVKVLETLVALETAFTGAYLGAIPLIQNKAVLSAAASIAMNEEAHLAVLRDAVLSLGGKVEGPQTPVGRAFAVAITPQQASQAVQGFVRR